MRDTFLDTAEQILTFKTHRDIHVRKMVVTLIPTLAVYDTQTFSEHHLHKAMAHLISTLEKPAERSVGKWNQRESVPSINLSVDFAGPGIAFIAIGHVASAVGSEMKPFLESVMNHIKQGLQMHGYVKQFPITKALVQFLQQSRLTYCTGRRTLRR